MGWSEGPFYRGAQEEQGQTVRKGQNLQGTQQLGMLGPPAAAEGGAGEGAAQKLRPSASRLRGRETGGNENVFVEEAAGLGRPRGLQLADCAEKVIPGRGKSTEVGEWERNI